ncbi:CLP1, cleavage and polyadenylation factor I subunit,-like protein, partial [Jimgerdemannia flammicorona]
MQNPLKTSKPAQDEGATKEWVLDPEHEFRFEVDYSATVKIKLTKGTAEIFGTELATGMSYEFSGRKVAVFSWHGCGKCSVEYQANETPMTSYLNTHLAIEQMRQDAQDRGEQGPRFGVAGYDHRPERCGYALRQGRQPIFVSLDTNEGSITMPGTLTATSITHIIDVEEGFGSSATTAASMGSSTMPLAYYFGHPGPAENVKLYKILMSRLAHAVRCRMAEDEE